MKDISLESKTFVICFHLWWYISQIHQWNLSALWIFISIFIYFIFIIMLTGVFKKIRKCNFLKLTSSLEITSLKTHCFTRSVSVWVSIWVLKVFNRKIRVQSTMRNLGGLLFALLVLFFFVLFYFYCAGLLFDSSKKLHS